MKAPSVARITAIHIFQLVVELFEDAGNEALV